MANSPVIYTLKNNEHARKFGLTPAQRDDFMDNCFRNRSGAKPRAIFCHVQEGWTVNSLDWAIGGGQNSWTVTAQQDGSILQCIDEKDGPWTNGAVRSPKPKAAKLINLGGNINIYTLSIEAEGFSTGDHPREQIEAIIWQVRTWQERYGITNDWVFEHADVDNVQRSNCAGWYYDEVRKAIDATTVPVPQLPTYPKPIVLPELQVTGTAPSVVPLKSGGEAVFVGDRVKATAATERKQWAGAKAPDIGPKLTPGETFNVDWMTKNDEGWWYITPFWTRIKVADCERVSDAKAA